MRLDDEIRREFDRATDEFRLVFYNGIRKIAESDEEEQKIVNNYATSMLRNFNLGDELASGGDKDIDHYTPAILYKYYFEGPLIPYSVRVSDSNSDETFMAGPEGDVVQLSVVLNNSLPRLMRLAALYDSCFSMLYKMKSYADFKVSLEISDTFMEKVNALCSPNLDHYSISYDCKTLSAGEVGLKRAEALYIQKNYPLYLKKKDIKTEEGLEKGIETFIEFLRGHQLNDEDRIITLLRMDEPYGWSGKVTKKIIQEAEHRGLIEIPVKGIINLK